MRIRDIAHTRIEYGYRRVLVQLRREGWVVNHKRICRLYRIEKLGLRRMKRRRRSIGHRREERVPATAVDHTWAMDFLHDNLFSGHCFRIFAVVDIHSRECLALEADRSLSGEDVARVLSDVLIERGRPELIRCDNGTEFTSKAMDKWAYDNHIALDFSRPGKPTDNAFIESFNARFRQEFLNQNYFLSLEDAAQKIESWRTYYNQERPHSALGNLAPSDYAKQHSQGTSAEVKSNFLT